ncbi:unnamed protein product [Soboliphyme baturini]|uniref:Uncharacterized protein n=1 Tax=Soboliphyme baturini TaxID=241478 RepID=A0A183IIG3_9BILA|nr:unnamed protein product [Soboliphyme baturini]
MKHRPGHPRLALPRPPPPPTPVPLSRCRLQAARSAIHAEDLRRAKPVRPYSRLDSSSDPKNGWSSPTTDDHRGNGLFPHFVVAAPPPGSCCRRLTEEGGDPKMFRQSIVYI